MLADTVNGIEITVNEAVVLQAIEEYLNRHMFKEPMKVASLGSRINKFDATNELFPAYEITCVSPLQRLAGETIH